MTLHRKPDPRRDCSRPGVDPRDDGDSELRRDPPLIAAGEGGMRSGSQPASVRSRVRSPEVAAAGQW
jgi:hypothetical protein